MRYLMLFLFPPVGIVMYLKDKFGPPKKIRYIVCLLSFAWMCFAISLIARIPMQNNQERAELESEIFDDPLAGKIENKTEEMKKDEFNALSDREKAEKIQSFLSDAIGDYAAIIFDDGTGIQFPGAEWTTAWYGEIQNDGQMQNTLGEVKLENGVYVLTEYSKEELLETEINHKIPDRFKSDATSVKVRKVNDGYYLAFVAICEEPTDDDYKDVVDVAKQCGITSGQIKFIDEFSAIMGKKNWSGDYVSSSSDSEQISDTEE